MKIKLLIGRYFYSEQHKSSSFATGLAFQRASCCWIFARPFGVWYFCSKLIVDSFLSRHYLIGILDIFEHVWGCLLCFWNLEFHIRGMFTFILFMIAVNVQFMKVSWVVLPMMSETNLFFTPFMFISHATLCARVTNLYINRNRSSPEKHELLKNLFLFRSMRFRGTLKRFATNDCLTNESAADYYTQ